MAGGGARGVVFFAIMPDVGASAQIQACELDLRRRFRQPGKRFAADRHHVSLLGVGVEPDEALTAAAMRIGDALAFAPFQVAFVKAVSFGKGPRRTLVLCASDGGTAAFRGVRDRLADAAEALGLTCGGRASFVPHLTIAHDDAPIPDTVLDEPIVWTARELVLVRSDQGLGRHTHLARWTL